MATRKATIYHRQPKLRFDPTPFETKQIFYTSKDGTTVVFLSHKKGLKLDGTNPTLLYGYGGFASRSIPDVRAIPPVLWMEMGGVLRPAQPTRRW